jgi:hypothetical protein
MRRDPRVPTVSLGDLARDTPQPPTHLEAGSVSGSNRNRRTPSGQAEGGPIAVRRTWGTLFPDTPEGEPLPDDVAAFAALVKTRKAHDYHGSRKHYATLLSLGWRIMPTEPRKIGGQT